MLNTVARILHKMAALAQLPLLCSQLRVDSNRLQREPEAGRQASARELRAAANGSRNSSSMPRLACIGQKGRRRKVGINLMPRYDSDRHSRNTFDFTSLHTENITLVYVSGVVLAVPLDPQQWVQASRQDSLYPIQSRY